jgi:CBS domain containing-hemolysin-like protein
MEYPFTNMHRRTTILTLLATLLIVVAASAAVVPQGVSGEVGGKDHLIKMLVYAGIALLFSFLCSVAEAVMLSISPSFVAHLEQQGKPAAKRIKKLKGNIDQSLAAILTLNTIAHTLGAGGAGAEAAAYFGDQYVGISMAVLTLLILFLSEIVPKTIGALYWRKLAGPTAWFVQLLIWVLYPLIWISERLTRLITRGKSVHTFSRDEFTALVDVGVEKGKIQVGESRVLKNLFQLPELHAEDVMTPRTVVFALQENLTLNEVMEEHPEIPFSRIPIYGENRDDITGFVLKTDLLIEKLNGHGEKTLKDIKREIFVVQETASLEQVSEQLLEHKLHMLVVLDEYGGLAGVVTLEDVVETLMGIEIVDEADQIDDLRRLARKKWQERMKRLGIDPNP